MNTFCFVRLVGFVRLVRFVRLAGMALALAAVAVPGAVRAEDTEQLEGDAGMGVAAGLATVVYAPTKVAYAIGGSVVAGLAYLVSGGDKAVTQPVLDASLRGDYVVTPEHLRGQKQLEFIGRPASDSELAAPPVAAAPTDPPADGLDGATAGATP